MRTWYKWFLLFEIANFYDAVYNRSGHLTALGDYLWGYVIVPSYLYVLLWVMGRKESKVGSSESSARDSEEGEGIVVLLLSPSNCPKNMPSISTPLNGSSRIS